MWSLATSLTVAAGVWTVLAYHRRHPAGVVAGLGLMLLPFAALFTGVLLLVMRIATAVGLWASGLVLKPSVWLGLAMAAGSFGLLSAARWMRRRAGSAKPDTARVAPAKSGELSQGRGSSTAPVDDDMTEIEAILRSRGIS